MATKYNKKPTKSNQKQPISRKLSDNMSEPKLTARQLNPSFAAKGLNRVFDGIRAVGLYHRGVIFLADCCIFLAVFENMKRRHPLVDLVNFTTKYR